MSNLPEPEIRTKPKVRLAFSRLLFRSTLLLVLLAELILWGEAGKLANPPAVPRWAIFVFYSPRFLFGAFLAAAVLTILADLLVRLVIRPAVIRWHSPRSDADAASFHLGAFESVVASTPARRQAGRIWNSGQLVRTSQRLWFFPNASDREPLGLPERGWSDARPVKSPKMFLGMVVDLPDLVRLTRGDGVEESFAVPDADEVVGWLEPSMHSNQGLGAARRAS